MNKRTKEMLHGIVERLTNDKLNKKLPNFTCYFLLSSYLRLLA